MDGGRQSLLQPPILHCMYRSPHAAESKTILDSGFHALDSGFQVLTGTGF